MLLNLVERAEQEVPIERVLMDLYGIESIQDAGGWKTFCPLGREHSDGGTSKAMRVYSDSNSSWCFSHGTRYTPVALWQMRYGTRSRRQAAKELLEHYGISTVPPTPEERWEKLDKAEVPESMKDLTDLQEALKFFARNHLPQYASRQYDPFVLDMMNRVYDTLDGLPPSADYDTMVEWLNKARGILKEVWRKNGWY